MFVYPDMFCNIYHYRHDGRSLCLSGWVLFIVYNPYTKKKREKRKEKYSFSIENFNTREAKVRLKQIFIRKIVRNNSYR